MARVNLAGVNCIMIMLLFCRLFISRGIIFELSTDPQYLWEIWNCLLSQTNLTQIFCTTAINHPTPMFLLFLFCYPVRIPISDLCTKVNHCLIKGELCGIIWRDEMNAFLKLKNPLCRKLNEKTNVLNLSQDIYSDYGQYIGPSSLRALSRN